MIYSSWTVATAHLRDKSPDEPWEVTEHPQGGYFLTMFGLPEKFFTRN